MNELSSIALILLLSLLAGHLVKFLHIPEVTGYIIAGIIVGPSVLGWINDQNLASLSIFSEVALALILFSIGSIFEFRRFREVGKLIVIITITECACVLALVTGARSTSTSAGRSRCCWVRSPWKRAQLRPSWCCASTTPKDASRRSSPEPSRSITSSA